MASRVQVSQVSGEDLYEFIRDHAEEVDGAWLCRASLIAYLRACGVENPKNLRTRLVKELTRQGLVERRNPRSRRLYILS